MREGFCFECDDGDGVSIFPYYGLAPHTHEPAVPLVGSTRILPRDQWPANFEPDSEDASTGSYLYCLNCKGSR